MGLSKACFWLLVCLLVWSDFVKCADEPFKCPEPNQIEGCTCIASIKYILCDNPKIFQFKGNLALETIEVKTYKELPLLDEKFDSTNTGLTAKTLVLDASNSPAVQDNLESLLSFPTEAIKITANPAKPVKIDLSGLSTDLKAISLANIEVAANFDITSFKNLKTIELKNVKLHDPTTNLAFVDSQLTRIAITGSANLKGLFSFKSSKCEDKEKIYIDLRNNPGLTDFDFSRLFAAPTPKCSYHVDLSQNKGLKPTFLKDQLASLNTIEPSQLYLVMHEVEIECGCQLYKFYHDDKKAARTNYIHSAQCNDLKPEAKSKFLSEVLVTDFKTACT